MLPKWSRISPRAEAFPSFCCLLPSQVTLWMFYFLIVYFKTKQCFSCQRHLYVFCTHTYANTLHTHMHTLGLAGPLINSCLANVPSPTPSTSYFLNFPSNTPYRRWSVFSFLCEVCRPLCPNKTMFHLFTFRKGWLEDAPAFRTEIKELLRHAGQLFPFHLNILFVTVCHS